MPNAPAPSPAPPHPLWRSVVVSAALIPLLAALILYGEPDGLPMLLAATLICCALGWEWSLALKPHAAKLNLRALRVVLLLFPCAVSPFHSPWWKPATASTPFFFLLAGIALLVLLACELIRRDGRPLSEALKRAARNGAAFLYPMGFCGLFLISAPSFIPLLVLAYLLYWLAATGVGWLISLRKLRPATTATELRKGWAAPLCGLLVPLLFGGAELISVTRSGHAPDSLAWFIIFVTTLFIYLAHLISSRLIRPRLGMADNAAPLPLPGYLGDALALLSLGGGALLLIHLPFILISLIGHLP